MVYSESITEEQLYTLALVNTAGIGDVLSKRIVDVLGSATEFFSLSEKELMNIPGIHSKTLASLLDKEGLKIAEKEIGFIEKNNIRVIAYSDTDYPRRLKNCIDSPAVLFCKGNMDLDKPKILSIVGTRQATSYGKNFIQELLQDLRKEEDLLIVSGLAYGIDIAAHKACLEFDIPTVGVLAHGLDRIYPAAHRSFAEKMLQNGGLLSDFRSNTNPDRENFPKRNRIIAGLSDATLVVESKSKGGAMITAEIAFNYNRDVLAVPGKYSDDTSLGCNSLIKRLKASLVENAQDISSVLGWNIKKPSKPIQQKLMINLRPEQQQLVDLLDKKGKMQADEICSLTLKPISEISAILFELELDGIVKSMPGKMFAMV